MWTPSVVYKYLIHCIALMFTLLQCQYGQPVNGMTMGDLYQRTIEKKRYLEDQGYVYVGKWECEFDREVRENDTLRNCVQQSEISLSPPFLACCMWTPSVVDKYLIHCIALMECFSSWRSP
jgi:hypothetical protein